MTALRLQLAGLCVYAAACVCGVVAGSHYTIAAGGLVYLAALVLADRRGRR